MSTNREEEMRLKFLNMAKQFNWNLSNISAPNPAVSVEKTQHNHSSFGLPTKENINRNADESFYDSEATESEDGSFVFRKQNTSLQHSPSNNNNVTSNLQRSSLQLTQANLSKLNESFQEKESNNIATHSHHSSLTQRNISRLNTSLKQIQFEQKETKSSHSSFSSSSVLSKHNFNLLDISLSEENKHLETKNKRKLKLNGGLLDLCSSSDEDDTFHFTPKDNKISNTDAYTKVNKPQIQKENNHTSAIKKKPKQIKKKDKILKPIQNHSNEGILCKLTLNNKQFKKERDQYTLYFFRRLNDKAFDSKLKLNDNITYSWCKTLNKTAGDCRLITRNKVRKAHIRLATKVLDTLDKLKQTLCHEMCHAMAWIMHAVRKPPHGKHFKYWGNKAECAFNDIRVTTCHNYKIQFKFQWKCTQCGYVYGRHSKSIKPETHRCGVCKGKLEFLGRLKADGTFAKTQERKPTAFTLFMKQHMKRIKKQFPGATHGTVMKILSEKYKLSKKKL